MGFQDNQRQHSMLVVNDSLTRSGAGVTTEVSPVKPVLPEILFLTTYPPRECGIATYSQDLIDAIEEKFGSCFSLKVCALEAEGESLQYPERVKYILPSADLLAYEELAQKINMDQNIWLVFVQHEFGLFSGEYGQHLLGLLCLLNKPVITTFHTILPAPDNARKQIVQTIATNSVSVISMTENGASILKQDYNIPSEKIRVIAHGTHLVSSLDHDNKSSAIDLGNRLVLATFGLLSPGKSIETALYALPAIVRQFPNVLYLIIGKTHPGITKQHGEQYRDMLHELVRELHLGDHVRFINSYLSLNDLLSYLERTNIYLFTSKDRFQIVSGTFAYAMACGCPVISTPIPHATEMLDGAGTMIDFESHHQLADAAITMLGNPDRLTEMKLNALHKIRPTAWPNSALAHIDVAMSTTHAGVIDLHYDLPPISLSHVRKLTTDKGMIQFSKLSDPELSTGYTVDDNARALIATCRYYKATHDVSALPLIEIYLDFVISCQDSDGLFLNYVAVDGTFTDQNQWENLEDANGRAVWALGEFMAHCREFDLRLVKNAELAFLKSLTQVVKMKSPRARSFVLKGLYNFSLVRYSAMVRDYIVLLADDLVAKHKTVSDDKWTWFEEYMTYANGVIPEALLCAYLASGDELYKSVARSCFDFLLGIIIRDDEIKVISNQGWLKKGGPLNHYGEQPVDIAYTVMALDRFCEVFPGEGYLEKMRLSFDWFLGKNHLKQIMYNPATGGCYDGLEEHHINLNQGAESTVSYLLSRLVMEKYFQGSLAKTDRLGEGSSLNVASIG